MAAEQFLRKDERFNSIIRDLNINTIRDYFEKHIEQIRNYRIAEFEKALKTCSPLDTEWEKDVWPRMSVHPAALVLREGNKDRENFLKTFWQTFQVVREAQAKAEFQELLQENKFVSFWVHKGDVTMDEIRKVPEATLPSQLWDDRRYLVLECRAEEREQILKDHLMQFGDKAVEYLKDKDRKSQ